MTKIDIAELLSSKIKNLSVKEANRQINIIFHTMNLGLHESGKLTFRGLGTFKTRVKKARPGLNPKTGIVHQVSARRVVVFKASKKLKEAVLKS